MIKSAIAILTVIAAGLSLAAAAPSQPVVETAYGAIEGRVREGVRIFKGIPYAAPPVGALRWRPPSPPAAWTGARDAGAFGPACLQPELPGGPRDFGPQSEDCLTLNIWTPANAEKAPVMVWIHGGAFRIGSSSLAFYDGAAFARSGVVLVSINYRLGGFGFFAHPALRDEGGPDADAANFGLLDQIAALGWVKDNIAAFGGDPENVTVFGESAGGASILYLLTSDRARGLFQKAIVESGGGQQTARCAWRACKSQAPASEAAIAWAASLGLTEQTPGNLRAVPARDVLAIAPISAGLGFGPLIDDHSVSGDIYERLASGKGAAVPLIIGFNSHEASLMETFKLSPETVFAAFGPAIDKARRAYRVEERGLSDGAFAAALFRDALFGAPAKIVAAKIHETGAPVWRYYYDYVLERRRGKAPGAGHGAEIPIVFDTLDALPAAQLLVSAEDRRMADQIHELLVNFAKSGEPRGTEINWPAINKEGDPVLVVSSGGVKAQEKFQAEELRFQEELFLMRRGLSSKTAGNE